MNDKADDDISKMYLFDVRQLEYIAYFIIKLRIVI
jgi:hypothetical protein